MTVSIPLGSEARVTDLYSFKNSPTCVWTLAETVKHWFDMTLDRDGLAEKGARASVTVGPNGYTLTLDGPDSVMGQLRGYATRLPQFLKNGEDALTTVVPKLKQDHWWDPHPDTPKPGDPPYHPWRFFLPHGMAMLNQKALLFFHYPPIRLLDTNQDYLDDPVPVRCEELLTANGVSAGDLPLFNTVMDATPIGAEDDQGSKKGPDIDPTWGCIPIQYFHDYQKAQVNLLLNVSPKNPDFTVPIVVYGAHPLATFNDIYGMTLKNNQVGVTEIIRGKKTAVLASTHPYVFYGTAQGFDKIGSGKLVNHKGATAQMIKDLAVARWLKLMSDDPSLNPNQVLSDSQKYWNDPAQGAVVEALVQHQGSLKYSDPTTLTFDFLIPLPTLGQAAPTPVVAASAPAKPKPALAQPALAAVAPASQPSPSPGKGGPLQVIGDSGKPVDWWFIYKISKEAEIMQGAQIPDATGLEYAYFDSDMAKNPKAIPVLSTNKIDGPGALHDTLSPLFSDAAKANPNLGWFCYNDEDHVDSRGAGAGPGDRGHCKGVLAFDLKSKSAFWLIHSVPLFPLKAEFNYPDTGHKMAQTMLCIQLEDDDTAEHIAQLMYDAHGPNVNVKSAIPAALAKDDPRNLLMQDLNGSMKRPTPYPPLPDGFLKAPYPGQVPFNSKGGTKFHALAKNKAWGLDLYNDFVSKVLDEDLEVETWENAGKDDKLVPPDQKPGEHDVENMKSVDLSPLKIFYSWSEKVDHAKLALSDRNNKQGTDRWVCVGDINFTLAQEKRGGGTVAFQCEPLWNNLALALMDKPEPPKGKKPASAKRSVSAKKPAAKKPAAKRSATKKAASRSRPAVSGTKAAAGAKKSTKQSAKKATVKSNKTPSKSVAAKKAGTKKKTRVPKKTRKAALKKSPAKRN